jgi:hypothetical protein
MPKLDITVVLPTAARPDMLRTALDSVAHQTAVSAVSQVIVIENKQERASGDICKLYSLLPIQYVFRDPPLPVDYEWFKDTFCRVQTEYVAILFDDDWWMPEHLQNAIQALSAEVGMVASYSSYVNIAGENSYIANAGNSFLAWFAASSALVNDRWVMSLEDLLVANLIATTGSFMTLVVKTDVWQKCFSCISHGNTYDVDRLLAVELGRYGKIAFTRRPTAYVRTHSGQGTHLFESGGVGARWWRDSTEKLISLASTEQIDLSNAFASRLHAKSVDIPTLQRYACHDSIEHLSSLGILQYNPTQFMPSTKSFHPPSFLSRAYRSLVPPLFQVAFDHVRSLPLNNMSRPTGSQK